MEKARLSVLRMTSGKFQGTASDATHNEVASLANQMETGGAQRKPVLIIGVDRK